MLVSSFTRLTRASFVAVALGAVVGLLTASPARAQELGIGDPAPTLGVKEFVKGAPVKSFEKGKNYVVEFWATWCGPCKVSIPHLTELQAKYKDIQFVGVSVWETDQSLVKPFVEKMGDKMGYSVAMDSVPPEAKNGNEGVMAKSWMTAAGRNGIPSAFIVNGDGKIAWIGHPMAMEKPLELVSTGKWDINKAAAEYRAATASERKMATLNQDIMKAIKAGDTAGAIAVMDKAVAEDPSLEQNIAMPRFSMLRQSGKNDEAAKYGKRLVDVVYKDNVMALNSLAWGIVDPEAKLKPTPQLVGLAVSAAKQADKVAGGKDPAIADTLAKTYFDSGDIKSALATQKRAVQLAKGTEFEKDKDMVARLEQYTKAANTVNR